jgi:glyoxylase-like metal-dependent hydrolase (beta-lactamase superfamily II)
MTGGKDVSLEGIAEVLAHGTSKVYAGQGDVDAITKNSFLPIEGMDDGDLIEISDSTRVRLISTPGHTTGSICIACMNSKDTVEAVITGDTLFVGAVGRTDLPESDVREMLQSLLRLSKLPPDTVVFPGHNYAEPPHTTIAQEMKSNPFMMQAQKLGTISSSEAAARKPAPGDFECGWECACCKKAMPIILAATARL